MRYLTPSCGPPGLSAEDGDVSPLVDHKVSRAGADGQHETRDDGSNHGNCFDLVSKYRWLSRRGDPIRADAYKCKHAFFFGGLRCSSLPARPSLCFAPELHSREHL
jgi:hypothetical protein